VENHDGSPLTPDTIIFTHSLTLSPQMAAPVQHYQVSDLLPISGPTITSWNWRCGEWCTLGFPNCKNLKVAQMLTL